MTRWLDAEEQSAWRSFIAVTRRFPELLNRVLQAKHGLTMTDYEILVQLSEAPERRMRMSDLAAVALLSRSRLSHQFTRMERAGLVAREECPGDRRGAYAVLTEVGWDTLVTAAPTHVESVRRYLLDAMPRAEFLHLGGVMQGVYEGFDTEAQAASSEACDAAVEACDAGDEPAVADGCGASEPLGGCPSGPE